LKSDLLIVVLAHNEAACIADTVAELRAVAPGAEVLVVDDGSRDDTAARAAAAGARVLRHPFNLGVAAGEASGLLYAKRAGFACVVRVDGDGQHDPQALQSVVAGVRDGADLVVGTRYGALETFQSTTLRRFGSRFLARLLSRLSGTRITDPTSGYRGFGPRAIAYFAEEHPHDYPEPESVLMAAQKGFRVVEVPVQMRPRRTGTSSLTALRSGFYMAKVSFALVLQRMRT
jgi:glycosyltransferase involved in cell wall biosynthesis